MTGRGATVEWMRPLYDLTALFNLHSSLYSTFTYFDTAAWVLLHTVSGVSVRLLSVAIVTFVA